MEVGLVRQIDIDAEMQQSYLDYAMSVIVARALPDAQDGLKPVHRRILYAMHAMGIRPTTGLKKSARIVGEVLGKFHPHGDMAVYDAMARMAQPFSMRYPLVDGQGNFGSVDGDPPAAMRYTEARLAPLSMELLAGIEKDTVDFVDNFDGSLQEPTVLPTAIPNLLLNGATGIAVGMATSIPPHNMGEVCDALVHMLDNWAHLDQISVDDLMHFIQGPDFPTGGIIVREPGEGEGLTAAYGSGRGKVVVQARAHLEDMSRGRSRILVTELPYLTNKSSLIERIAELARSGELEGLADLRDESDRQGLRIVIELTKTAEPQKVLAELYRRTPMQTTFGINMLALVEGEPRLLNLKQALRVYLEHRLVVVRRRSEFDLARARERAHILEGLRIALAHLDEVIQIIRGATDADQAQQRLMRRYRLSEVQAGAILDMPLRRLAGLERKKIDQEYKETVARIKELEALLASEKKMRAVIAEELTKVKEQYGDRRRTQIVQARRGKRGAPLLTATDLAPDKDTWVVVTADGLISRTATARLPRLAGRSAPILVLGARGRDTLYLFDAAGNGAALAVHTLPEVDDPKDGNPVAGSTPFPPEARVVAGVALSPDRGPGQGCLFFCTRAGMVKRVMLDALPGPSARSFTAMNVSAGDSLGWVRVTSGGDEVLLVSGAGLAILFAEVEVRPTGLAAGGVLGIRLADERTIVVAMDTARPQSDLLLVTENGQAKRTPVSQFPTQGRHGKGVRAWKASGEARLAGAAVGLGEDRAVAHLARAAAHSLRFADFPRRSRAAAGKLAFEVKAGDRVTDVAGIVARPTFKPLEVETVAEASAPKRKAARRETPPKGRRRAARREPAKSKVARTPKKASGPGDGAAKKKRRPKSKAGGGKR